MFLSVKLQGISFYKYKHIFMKRGVAYTQKNSISLKVNILTTSKSSSNNKQTSQQSLFLSHHHQQTNKNQTKNNTPWIYYPISTLVHLKVPSTLQVSDAQLLTSSKSNKNTQTVPHLVSIQTTKITSSNLDTSW